VVVSTSLYALDLSRLESARSGADRSKVSPRSRRSAAVPVLQSELYQNMHVESRHNLGSVEGIRSALEEVECVRRSLQQRLKSAERGGELEEVISEGSSGDEQNEDEEEEEENEEDEGDDEDSFEL
jgi:hypothetical protein